MRLLQSVKREDLSLLTKLLTDKFSNMVGDIIVAEDESELELVFAGFDCRITIEGLIGENIVRVKMTRPEDKIGNVECDPEKILGMIQGMIKELIERQTRNVAQAAGLKLDISFE